MMTKTERPPRVFIWLYKGNIALIFLIPFLGVFNSLSLMESISDVWFIILFGFVYGSAPFCAIFLFLNLWGLVRYSQNRNWYVVAALISVPCVILGIKAWMNTAFP